LKPPEPGTLVSPEELSQILRRDYNLPFSPERLIEMAEHEGMPHMRVDGREIRFTWLNAKRWISDHYLRGFPAREEAPRDSDEFMRQGFGDRYGADPPEVLRWMGENLHEFPIEILRPSRYVYFLVSIGEIIYIGTTANVGRRLVAHLDQVRFDRAFFVTVPKEDAFGIERGFIAMFRPRLNLSFHKGCSEREIRERFAGERVDRCHVPTK
jgi:hypothetical protein